VGVKNEASKQHEKRLGRKVEYQEKGNEKKLLHEWLKSELAQEEWAVLAGY
jgi:hypothetical protein